MAVCGVFLLIAVLTVQGASTIWRGVKRTEYVPAVPTLKKDANLCELLNRNDRRMLVVGNLCFLYRFYDAKPDCRYLYQCPIGETAPVIWEELLEEVRSKKTPLIFVQKEKLENVPEYFMDFLHDNYERRDCLQGMLFVLDAPEKTM